MGIGVEDHKKKIPYIRRSFIEVVHPQLGAGKIGGVEAHTPE